MKNYLTGSVFRFWLFVLGAFATTVFYAEINSIGQSLDAFLKIDKETSDYFTSFIQNDLVLGLAGVVVTIVSVSLPIAISAISDHLKEFNSKAAFDYFTSEPIFRFQVYHLGPLISIFTMMIVWKMTCVTLFGFTCGFFLFSIWMFQRFIELILSYAINTDEIIEGKARSAIQEYIQ